MFAITLDGKILMNAHALDHVDIAELAGKKGVFVGIALRPSEVRMLSEHLDDASSSAAAFISGARRKRTRRRKK